MEWLAARLHADLGVSEPLGTIDISFYRDDFATKGISANVKTTDVAVDLTGRDVILCDDILNSGRSVRAALNEILISVALLGLIWRCCLIVVGASCRWLHALSVVHLSLMRRINWCWSAIRRAVFAFACRFV